MHPYQYWFGTYSWIVCGHIKPPTLCDFSSNTLHKGYVIIPCFIKLWKLWHKPDINRIGIDLPADFWRRFSFYNAAEYSSISNLILNYIFDGFIIIKKTDPQMIW